MATIKEVARLAGVSTATVSRVFNDVPVSDDKVRRVRKAAETLDFVPNRTARSLRRQASELIALVIPDIENPFFTTLARGVEDRARDAGFSVVLCNSDSDDEKESRYLDIARSENMAGVIIAPGSPSSDIPGYLRTGRPIVAVYNRTPYDIDSVLIDHWSAATEATRSLVESGHTRIACIAGRPGAEPSEERIKAWRATASRVMDDVTRDSLLRHTDFRASGGRAAMVELLDLPEPPDAVVALNNLVAVGALQALAQRGIGYPDFGVAAVGDLPYMTTSPDAITRVHLPAREIGVRAAEMLLERISGDRGPARVVTLPNVVERAH